jgi:hypothetical protein
MWTGNLPILYLVNRLRIELSDAMLDDGPITPDSGSGTLPWVDNCIGMIERHFRKFTSCEATGISNDNKPVQHRQNVDVPSEEA